jgi:fucose 4-O-acetylase-like acetyltransferase
LALHLATAAQPITRTALRWQRIDSFRLYAILLIVWGHIQLLSTIHGAGPIAKIAELTLAIGARFTMPFFFILAGYFTGGKIAREPSKAVSVARAYTARLAVVFLFWCFIYALEQPQNFLNLVREQPIKFIFEGSRPHLWFLVSLILTVWLYALWPFHKSHKSFLALGAVLYVIGLLGGSYNVTPIGFDMHFNTRDGFFLSTLFFAIGVAFHNRMPRISKKMALGIAVGGLAIFSLEAFYLRIQWNLSPCCHDYLLGTIPFGVGVTLLALSRPDSSIDRLVGPYGQYTLGVYASHLLFMDLLEPVGSFVDPLVWQLVAPIPIFCLALLTSIILARTPLRRVVI